MWIGSYCIYFFFFNDTATTEIYTLSLHDRSSDLRDVTASEPPRAVLVACLSVNGHPLKGIRRHADIVLVDIRGVVLLAAEGSEDSIGELDLAVNLAEHCVALLPGLQQRGAVAIIRPVQPLRRVADRADAEH